ncbi:MAG: 23S rRNA (uracil(1939)-C(5))-methyltransferase RlmD [Pelovirga sp.]
MLPPLTIETLVNGGAGLARHQGHVVFIPHTAVGDRVRARLTRQKKNYLEAELVEVLAAGEQRCVPLCPVAGECGGCQWQHLTYAAQLAWKETLFHDTLTHQCGATEEVLAPIIPSPRQWHYRSRVQVKCYNSAAGFSVGFYRPRSRYVVAIQQCPIMAPALNELLVLLHRGIAGTEHAGFIPQLDLAVDDCGKTSVVVHYIGEKRTALVALLQSLRLKGDILVQYRTKKTLGLIQGDGIMQIHVDNPQMSLAYATGSFAQINLAQNRNLVDRVLALVPWRQTDQVLELYCGMGNFSLPIARRVAHLVGVEESATAIAMAQSNAARNRCHNTEFYPIDAEAALQRAELQRNYDTLVVDPPRTGAYSVIKGLAGRGIRNLVYISCDAQTLARDLRPLLQQGYRIVKSQPLDMFPQTYHCESVTFLQKDASCGAA